MNINVIREREKRGYILCIGNLNVTGFLNSKFGNKTGKYIFKILMGTYFYLKIIWGALKISSSSQEATGGIVPPK